MYPIRLKKKLTQWEVLDWMSSQKFASQENQAKLGLQTRVKNVRISNSGSCWIDKDLDLLDYSLKGKVWSGMITGECQSRFDGDRQ